MSYPDPSPKLGDSDNTLLFKIAQMLADGGGGAPGAGVSSFNSRTGAVTLLSADVTGALGFTPLSQAAGDVRYVLKTGDTMTGALAIAQGAIVASAPALNITQTWNNAAVTFIGINANYTGTAFVAESNLLNLQISGVNRYTFTGGGVARFVRHEQNNSGFTLFLRKRGNSVSVDGAVAADSTISVINASAWDGVTFSVGAHIDSVAGEAWTNVARGTRLLFYTTPIGSTSDQITLRLAESGQSLFRDGTAALPAVSFQSELDVGIYRVGSNELGLSVGGTLTLDVVTSGVRTVAGSNTTPAYSFIGDPNTGIYNRAANLLTFASDGENIMEMSVVGGVAAITCQFAPTEISIFSDSEIGAFSAANNDGGFRLTSTSFVAQSNINGSFLSFRITDDGSSNAISITSTGDVSIGIPTGDIGFFGVTPQPRPLVPDLINNVTPGGTDDTIEDFTSLTVYATDAATIRNNFYRLAEKVGIIIEQLQANGLFAQS